MLSNILNPKKIRKTIINILYNSKGSHLGTNLSAVESLISMYSFVDKQKILNNDENRERVIISKGHCSAATCSILYHSGIISLDEINTYHLDNSKLAGHVSHAVKGIEHSTGALGHGLSVALGCAIGLRARKNNSMVMALCGDGEIQEGSIWEAIMLLSHLKINNFVIIIDNNQISSITDTHKVIDMRPLKKRFTGFGINTEEVDGHNVDEITKSIIKIKKSNLPGVIIANTTKGKGFSFSENQPIWHYRNLDEETYKKAIEELKI
jgi:transketolase